MWWFHDRIGAVEVGITDRFGGLSSGAYAELNLALHTSDDPALVQANRDILAREFSGTQVVFADQAHGDTIVDIVDDRTFLADGLITTQRERAIGVLVADCVPLVVMHDDQVGVFHLGRRGLMSSLLDKAIERFSHLHPVTAMIGPHACGSCYELSEEIVSEVESVHPHARSVTRWGTPGIDMGRIIRTRLESAGIAVHPTMSNDCTIENDRFFSHRSEKLSNDERFLGRQAAVVMIHDS